MGAWHGQSGDVHPVPVDAGALAVLPGTDFADAFRVAVDDGLTAPQLAERIFARSPAWVGRLMALRDRVMAPFGLRTAAGEPFPVVASDDGRVVLGFDDKHLDFRLLVDVAGGMVTVTTLVRRNNLLGRIYLTAILPFHRAVARAMLANVGRRP